MRICRRYHQLPQEHPLYLWKAKEGIRSLFSPAILIEQKQKLQKDLTALNDFILGSPYEHLSLEKTISDANDISHHFHIFNLSCNIWNRGFFLQGLTPHPFTPPADVLADIDLNFGSLDALQVKMKGIVQNLDQDAWLWLVSREGVLEVLVTPPTSSALIHNDIVPLANVDISRHTYSVDHTDPGAYIEAWFNYLNWDFVSHNLENTDKTWQSWRFSQQFNPTIPLTNRINQLMSYDPEMEAMDTMLADAHQYRADLMAAEASSEAKA